MSILEFQHVSKVYHNTTRALDDLSFFVNEGEFVSIIGPSGAGKSTILRCINRLIDATEGKMCIRDRPKAACVIESDKRSCLICSWNIILPRNIMYVYREGARVILS